MKYAVRKSRRCLNHERPMKLLLNGKTWECRLCGKIKPQYKYSIEAVHMSFNTKEKAEEFVQARRIKYKLLGMS